MDEDHCDDMSIGLLLTQFMDEWYYRILHCGMAAETNKPDAARKALDFFEACGVEISDMEKDKLCMLGDEDMVSVITEKMPYECRKSFHHLVLQVQLVMSATSRVRSVLDEGAAEEVARTMDDGDQGVNAQILRQTIVSAGDEVMEMLEAHNDWLSSTNKRLARMGRAQQELERAKQELDRANVMLQTMPGDQGSNAKKVLAGMATKNEKTLAKTAFSAWAGWYQVFRNEKAIHLKFRAQLHEAQTKLMQYKQQNVSNIRGVLQRNAEGSHRFLLAECIRVWAKDVTDEKEDREMGSELSAGKEKMEALKAGQKDNAKKSISRMMQATDESLRNMAFQEWKKDTAYMKKNRDYEDMVEKQEAKVQEYMKAKGDQAKSVLTRMTSGTETGVMKEAFKAWAEDMANLKRAKELEDILQENQQKFVSLNSRAKSSKSNSASRANDLESENTVMMIFMNWATECRLSGLVYHYGGQMDQKKQQLEAVQSMFKSFATQIDGIQSTPRTTRRGRGNSRPPMPGHSPS